MKSSHSLTISEYIVLKKKQQQQHIDFNRTQEGRGLQPAGQVEVE
jgi:hypothetical protein